MVASGDMASNSATSSLARSAGNTLDAVLLTVVLALSVLEFVSVQFDGIVGFHSGWFGCVGLQFEILLLHTH